SFSKWHGVRPEPQVAVTAAMDRVAARQRGCHCAFKNQKIASKLAPTPLRPRWPNAGFAQWVGVLKFMERFLYVSS
ncbi:hypothetical protein, partial [Pseudomonas sp.]|uniref:hypothetical protein n=1 Tax=Pseudomonas sp. TaxID=306 RepID=UPI002618AEB5